MDQKELEKKFTSMLFYSDTLLTYLNLASTYFTFAKNCRLETEENQRKKLRDLRNGDSKNWITQIFTEGLDIPPALYQINIIWLKFLEESI